MLQKWYELTCDCCGSAINHYIGSKPSREMLKQDGVIICGDKHFCSDECKDEYSGKKFEK